MSSRIASTCCLCRGLKSKPISKQLPLISEQQHHGSESRAALVVMATVKQTEIFPFFQSSEDGCKIGDGSREIPIISEQ